MKHLNRKTITAAGAAVVLGIAIAIAGCGSGDEDSGGSTNASGAAAQPIKIGFLNAGIGTGNVNPYAAQAAEAAESHINDDLGGVNGHPIELEICQSDGTPENDGTCAQKAFAAKPLAVGMASMFNMANIYQAQKGTDIPIFSMSPQIPEDLTAKNAVFFGGGTPGYLSQQGYWINDVLKPKSVAIAYDNPGAAAALPLLTGALKDNGVKIKSVLVDPRQSDWLATYRTLTQDDPDYILGLFGSESSCIGLAKARLSQQGDEGVWSSQTCLGENVTRASGPDMKGWYIGQVNLDYETVNPPGPDLKTYLTALDKYTDGKTDARSNLAFANVMTIYGILKTAEKKYGFKGLTGPRLYDTAVESPGEVFMGGPYDCTEAPAEKPAVCVNTYQDYEIVDDDGSLDYAPEGKRFTYTPEGERISKP